MENNGNTDMDFLKSVSLSTSEVFTRKPLEVVSQPSVSPARQALAADENPANLNEGAGESPAPAVSGESESEALVEAAENVPAVDEAAGASVGIPVGAVGEEPVGAGPEAFAEPAGISEPPEPEPVDAGPVSDAREEPRATIDADIVEFEELDLDDFADLVEGDLADGRQEEHPATEAALVQEAPGDDLPEAAAGEGASDGKPDTGPGVLESPVAADAEDEAATEELPVIEEAPDDGVVPDAPEETAAGDVPVEAEAAGLEDEQVVTAFAGEPGSDSDLSLFDRFGLDFDFREELEASIDEEMLSAFPGGLPGDGEESREIPGVENAGTGEPAGEALPSEADGMADGSPGDPVPVEILPEIPVEEAETDPVGVEPAPDLPSDGGDAVGDGEPDEDIQAPPGRDVFFTDVFKVDLSALAEEAGEQPGDDAPFPVEVPGSSSNSPEGEEPGTAGEQVFGFSELGDMQQKGIDEGLFESLDGSVDFQEDGLSVENASPVFVELEVGEEQPGEWVDLDELDELDEVAPASARMEDEEFTEPEIGYYDDFDGDPSTDSGHASFGWTEGFGDEFEADNGDADMAVEPKGFDMPEAGTGGFPPDPTMGEPLPDEDAVSPEVIIEDPIEFDDSVFGTQASSRDGYDDYVDPSPVMDVEAGSPITMRQEAAEQKETRRLYKWIILIVLAIVGCFVVGVAIGASSCSRTDGSPANQDPAPAASDSETANAAGEAENSELPDSNLNNMDDGWDNDLDNMDLDSGELTSVVDGGIFADGEDGDEADEDGGVMETYVYDTSRLEELTSDGHIKEMRAALEKGPLSAGVGDDYDTVLEEVMELTPKRASGYYVKVAEDKKIIPEEDQLFQEDIDDAVRLLEQFEAWTAGFDVKAVKVSNDAATNIELPGWAGTDGRFAAIFASCGDYPAIMDVVSSESKEKFLFLDEPAGYSGTVSDWSALADASGYLDVSGLHSNADSRDLKVEVVPLSQAHMLTNGKVYHGNRVLLIPEEAGRSMVFKDIDGKADQVSAAGFLYENQVIQEGVAGIVGDKTELKDFDGCRAIEVRSSGDWKISW